MSRWITNGIAIVLAILIPVAGYFSLDALYALLPDTTGQITVVEDAAATPLLYVDESESLTFYPWTLYNEKVAVPLKSLFTEENHDPDIWVQFKELSGHINEAFGAMGHPINGLSSETLIEQMRYQDAAGKAFLHRCEVTGSQGEPRYLDVVWDDNKSIESIHISPANPSTEFSNDERMQYIQSLDKLIQKERKHFTEYYSGLDMPIVQAILTPPHYSRLRDFFIQYNNANRWNGSYLGEDALAALLYYGKYHMVFYEGEILLFFMMQATEISSEIDGAYSEVVAGDPDTGLLLYIDPQTFLFNGYSVLDLTV